MLFAVFAVMVAAATRYPPQARLMPLVIGIPAAFLCAIQLGRSVTRREPEAVQADAALVDTATLRLGAVWLILFIVFVLSGGFRFGGPIAVAASQRFWLKESWRTSVISGVMAFVLIYVVLEEQLGVVLFEGWLNR